MRPLVFTSILLLAAIAATASALARWFQEPPPRQAVRAARPHFTPRDWQGIYFDNLFREGLVGARPHNFGQVAQAGRTEADGVPGATPAGDAPTGETNGWSSIIDAVAIEDEIKRLQIELDAIVATPTRFASEYPKARQIFNMLALLFGVIEQYDGEIRWKREARGAQAVFGRAAVAARVGSQQAFQSSRLRRDELQELVRGGSFPVASTEDEEVWTARLERTPLMTRLDVAYQQRLRPALTDAGTLRSQYDEALHEAQLIAVIMRVLGTPGMIDADFEDYVEHADAALTAAQQTVSALRRNEFELARQGANLLEQSCNQCHADWR